jgi:hypothetical protein
LDYTLLNIGILYLRSTGTFIDDILGILIDILKKIVRIWIVTYCISYPI